LILYGCYDFFGFCILYRENRRLSFGIIKTEGYKNNLKL